MSVSYAQRADFTCPECGAPFAADVWLIVDVGERPDLLERIHAGTLHDVTCPNGHTRTVDAPLLLYRPGEDPPLLFSPARATTAEQDQTQAGVLVGFLRERLGSAWRDEWLQRTAAVPREALPTFLAEGPEAAMRQLASEAQAELERLRTEDPETYAKLEEKVKQASEAAPLAQTLFAFVSADTWAESRRIVEAHPELLTDDADSLLEQLIESARAQNDANAVRIFEEHRALLRRCRDAGIEQAFAERKKPQIAEEIPPEMRPLAEALAALPKEHRNALAEIDRNVHSPAELEAAVNARPALRAAPEQALAAALSSPREGEGIPVPPGGEGIPIPPSPAGRGAGGEGIPIPPAFRDDLRRAIEAEARYLRTGDLQALDEAVAAWERIWAHPDFAAAPQDFRLAALNDGGGAFLRRHRARGRMEDLAKAMDAWEQAVKATPAGSPERAAILNNLGSGLRDRYAQTREPQALEAALKAHEQAFNFLEARLADSPVPYKLGQQGQFAAVYADLVSARLLKANAAPPEAPALRRDALVVAEMTKSRVLTALMSRGLPLPPGVPVEEAAREAHLFEELTNLDEKALLERGATPQDTQVERLRMERREQVVGELRGIWSRWAKRGGELADWVALRRADPPKWEDLARLADDLGPETALMSFFALRDGIALFVLRAGWQEPRAFTVETLRGQQGDILQRLVREVHLYDRTDRRGETWDRLLQPLLAEALPLVGEACRIVFAPQSFGHLLPWAVALRRAGWQGRLVAVPALGLLPRLRDKARPTNGKALVAGNPLPTPELNLPYAEEEARQVAAMLGAQPLLRHQATKQAVLAALSDASIIHLATHAYFHGGSPLDSGILLADGILTAREVMQQRLEADLLVLSACETGIAGTLGGDELAGLAQAFLYAGARSLLVSLWSVDDPATAALMTAFYQARQNGADKAEALRTAMDFVRSQPRWAHTYYWGAFVLMGDWT